MRFFPLKTPEGKVTTVVLDSYELSLILAKAIGEKLGIDIDDDQTIFCYLGEQKKSSIGFDDYQDIAVSLRFLEKGNKDA